MKLDLQVGLSQKLILTQSMRQSLELLQLPLMELSSCVRELSLSNPLIDIDDAPSGDVSLDSLSSANEDAARFCEDQASDNGNENPSINIGEAPDSFSDMRSGIPYEDLHSFDSAAAFTRLQSFNEFLHEELRLRTNIEPEYLGLISYLIDCLSSTGYLDISLDELSAELCVPLFKLEEALFILQSFEPRGVGARSLSECLLLQLSHLFDYENDSALSEPLGHRSIDLVTAVIMKGLPLLAKHDFKGLSKLLNASSDDIKLACELITGLNPIPSAGFPSDSPSAVIIPDAFISVNDGSIDITVNKSALPQISLNKYYSHHLKSEDCDESAKKYLESKLKDAADIMDGISNRANTLERILLLIAKRQRGFFLCGDDLAPLTRSELAGELSLSSSTVSRAVKGQYIRFNGRILPLDSFFTNAVGIEHGQSISSHAVKEQLIHMIADEDKKKPLSDKAIEERLSAVGISISRRTVAKYRDKLNIPPASQRKCC